MEIVFGVLHLAPAAHASGAAQMSLGFAWDYTTWLNLVLLCLAAVLLWRFMTTGGPTMLKMMEQPGGGHDHSHHREAAHSG